MTSIMDSISKYYSNSKPFDPIAYLQQQRQLPNGGGSYNVADSAGGPTSNVSSGLWQGPVRPPVVEPPVVEQQPSVFSQPVANQQAPATNQQPPVRSKYINPATGEYYTPQEYANSVAMKIPASKGTGDIPQYAGDAVTKPDESTPSLTARARNLSNTRNDIATGTTDPYKVGTESGIAYSPAELSAIESAYAGIYDPALNDVFERLKTREDEQKRKQEREDKREDKIFATNESIRAWRATTGTKSGSDEVKFTNSNILNGASRAGLTPEEFGTLDPDIKNYFVNPPKLYDHFEDKEIPVTLAVKRIIAEFKASGSKEDAIENLTSIGLPPGVTAYLIGTLPNLSEEEKQSSIAKFLKFFVNFI